MPSIEERLLILEKRIEEYERREKQYRRLLRDSFIMAAKSIEKRDDLITEVKKIIISESDSIAAA